MISDDSDSSSKEEVLTDSNIFDGTLHLNGSWLPAYNNPNSVEYQQLENDVINQVRIV